MNPVIRHAAEADLPRILEIYAQARTFMAAAGNPTQWTDGYPQEALVRGDLAQGHLFVYEQNHGILGVFCYFEGEEPDYARIHGGAWIRDGSYGVVHRIAVASGSKGIGAACLKDAFSRCGNLRIDTHRNNLPMQRLLAKTGFRYCGIIYLTKDGSERLAYQKTE